MCARMCQCDMFCVWYVCVCIDAYMHVCVQVWVILCLWCVWQCLSVDITCICLPLSPCEVSSFLCGPWKTDMVPSTYVHYWLCIYSVSKINQLHAAAQICSIMWVCIVQLCEGSTNCMQFSNAHMSLQRLLIAVDTFLRWSYKSWLSLQFRCTAKSSCTCSIPCSMTHSPWSTRTWSQS